jgi:hypothetical protein
VCVILSNWLVTSPLRILSLASQSLTRNSTLGVSSLWFYWVGESGQRGQPVCILCVWVCPSICVSCSSYLSCSLCSSSSPAINLMNPWRLGHIQGVNPYHWIFVVECVPGCDRPASRSLARARAWRLSALKWEGRPNWFGRIDFKKESKKGDVRCTYSTQYTPHTNQKRCKTSTMRSPAVTHFPVNSMLWQRLSGYSLPCVVSNTVFPAVTYFPVTFSATTRFWSVSLPDNYKRCLDK